MENVRASRNKGGANGDAGRPSYPIESVDNALKLLLMLDERGQIRVSEAAKEIDVAPSTAHRLLAMLQYYGFVRQDGMSRAYVVGPALAKLGLAAVRQMDIRTHARPFLEELRSMVDETVHLAVLVETEVMFVDCIESSKALRVASRVGTSMLAHCTSVGKALLAALPDERLLELYPRQTLPGLTGKSIRRRDDLLAELEGVRKRSYAASSGESEDGVGSVGAAAVDRFGDVRGAISAAAPLPRLPKARLNDMAAAVKRCAEQIGHALP